MKAVYLYPSDIGLDEYSEKWISLIKQFGYTDGTPWNYLLLVSIIA